MSDQHTVVFTRFVCNSIDAGLRYPDFVRAAKIAYIRQVLDRNHGNQSHAARELGMHRNTLNRTLHELGIETSPRGRRWAKGEEVKPEASVA